MPSRQDLILLRTALGAFTPGAWIAALLAGVLVLAAARRRDTGEVIGALARETRKRDRGAVTPSSPEVQPVSGREVEAAAALELRQASRGVATLDAKPPVAWVPPDPEALGVTRRQFFNRALGATFFTFLGVLGLDVLSFLWPKLSGGFGSDVNVGPVQDLLDQAVNADGSVTPVFIPEARAYVVPAPAALSTQFEGLGVAVGGVMALWQRCVHLGCRVPWCSPSQGFECPCHGSKYNGVGEYFAGPAPRNLDRFVVELNDSNELIIKTGSVIQTPRALLPSVSFPQGPSCI